ncbi:MAG: tetratricopeptide repeat protein, partial [Myxococcota bacterium]
NAQANRVLPTPAGPTNITAPSDPFVGREQAQAKLREALVDDDEGHRVVLVGPAGVGKTRLACAFARAHLASFVGGAWLCDLQPCKTLDDVVIAVARAMDIPLGRRAPIEQLAELFATSSHRTLLILDNAEHLLAIVERFLDHCVEGADMIRVLITSRQTIVRARTVHHHLGPLPVPEPSDTVEQLATSPAAALFMKRMARHRPDLQITEDNRSTLIALVRLLDGLPLALELAAARTRLLTLDTLLARLDRRLALLKDTQRSTGRHTTLQMALDDSWELLSPAEQAALAQSSVFAGSFSLDAAEAVIDITPWSEEVVDVLEGLLNKSLLLRAQTPYVPRLRLLESIRAYALNKLKAPEAVVLPVGGSATGPEATQASRVRHGMFFASHGSLEGIEALHTAGSRQLLALHDDLGNLLDACRWAVSVDCASIAACTAVVASELLLLRGPFGFGAQMVGETLGVSSHTVSDEVRLLELHAQFLRLSGDKDRGLEQLERAESLLDMIDAPLLHSRVEGHLAICAKQAGEPEEARRRYTRAIAIADEAGDRRFQSIWRGELAILDSNQGRIDEAIRGYRQARQISADVGDRRFQAIWTANLATCDRNQGRYHEAMHGYREALQIARELGDRRFEGSWGNLLAGLEHDLGLIRESRKNHHRARLLNRLVGNRRAECVSVGNLAVIDHEAGYLRDAQRGFEEAISIAEAIQNVRFVLFWRIYRALVNMELGHLDDAERELHEVMTTLEHLGLKRFEGLVRVGLGRLADQRGELETACAQFEQAVAVAESLQDPREASRWRIEWADALRRLGQPEQAHHQLRSVETTVQELGDHLALAQLLSVQGLLEDKDTAQQMLLQAETLLNQLHMTPVSQTSRRVRALAMSLGPLGPSRSSSR